MMQDFNTLKQDILGKLQFQQHLKQRIKHVTDDCDAYIEESSSEVGRLNDRCDLLGLEILKLNQALIDARFIRYCNTSCWRYKC